MSVEAVIGILASLLVAFVFSRMEIRRRARQRERGAELEFVFAVIGERNGQAADTLLSHKVKTGKLAPIAIQSLQWAVDRYLVEQAGVQNGFFLKKDNLVQNDAKTGKIRGGQLIDEMDCVSRCIASQKEKFYKATAMAKKLGFATRSLKECLASIKQGFPQFEIHVPDEEAD